MKRKRWKVSTKPSCDGPWGPTYVTWDGKRVYKAKQCKKCGKEVEVAKP